MRKDEHARGADEPEESAEGGGPPEEGQANDEQSRVEGLLGYDLITHLHRLRCCAVKRGQNKEDGAEATVWLYGRENQLLVTYPIC